MDTIDGALVKQKLQYCRDQTIDGVFKLDIP